VDLACDTEDLSTLCELISGSEPTAEALSTATFTVFAPTNEAFYNIDAELFDELVNCTDALNSVLAFHTVPGVELYSTDLVCTETTTMSNGDDSRTVCREGKVFQKGSLNTKDAMPEIVAADIEACNGVIHIVDEVMIPKAKAIAICEGDVAADTYEGPRNQGTPPPKDECSTIGKWTERSPSQASNTIFAFFPVSHLLLANIAILSEFFDRSRYCLRRRNFLRALRFGG
jgi:transforming growth factor-beta-induced protein